MSNGEYSEFLPGGGKLVVNAQNWYIHYYFPLPELKYRGESFYIHDSQIDDYIAAWKENLKKYKELKDTVPTEYITRGKMGMLIAVNSHHSDGVSLTSHRGVTVKTEKELKNVIDGYEFAKKRAEVVMAFLRQL